MSQLAIETNERWCTTCGSLVPPMSDVCPHCGMPMPRLTLVPPLPDPEEETIESRPTSFIPRLASALPDESGPADESPRRERSTLAFIVAAVCAVILLGGVSLLVFHPWDPDLYDTRAQKPADTSMEGFPGTIDRLQGQDTEGVAGITMTSDQITHRDLDAALASLDAYAEELDAEFEVLARDFTADAAVREADAAEANATSIGISNVIRDVQEMDMSSGTYLESQRRIVQLGNYLRNRADAITGAWEVSLASDDPAIEKLRTLDSADAVDGNYGSIFRDSRRAFTMPEPEG